jgi:hypothetical protein
MALLGDFAADDGSTGIAVLDPFGADEAVYEETFAILERMVGGMMDRLEPILHP